MGILSYAKSRTLYRRSTLVVVPQSERRGIVGWRDSQKYKDGPPVRRW